jgi:hypothetical protein
MCREAGLLDPERREESRFPTEKRIEERSAGEGEQTRHLLLFSAELGEIRDGCELA